MSERDFDRLSDEEFERFLQQEASGINVSERIAKSVNPWKKSTNMIFAGLVLQLFGIGIFYLNYILPFVGSLLITLGFRMLSNENKWFRAGFTFSMLRSTTQAICLVFESALIMNQSLQTIFSWSWWLINAVLTLCTIGCLWGGFSYTQKEAGMPVRTKSLGVLFFIHLVTPLFSFIHIYLNFLLILLPVMLIIIVVCFRRIINDISASGYAIYPKTVKIPNWVIITIFMTITFVGVLIGNFFFTSYPMDYQLVEACEEEESVLVKEQLMQMNFPKQFISDLTQDDLKECTNVVRIVVSEPEGISGVDNWRGDIYFQYVFVQTQAEKETWKIFCFYNWTQPPATYRTDQIYIRPVYDENMFVDWEKIGDISGRVLCEKDGKTYSSSYYLLEENVIWGNEELNSINSILGSQEKRSIWGRMSFLMGSEKCRGYISYKVQLNGELDVTKMGMRYGHFNGFVYPYTDRFAASSKYWEYKDVTFAGSNLAWYNFPYFTVVER